MLKGKLIYYMHWCYGSILNNYFLHAKAGLVTNPLCQTERPWVDMAFEEKNLVFLVSE